MNIKFKKYLSIILAFLIFLSSNQAVYANHLERNSNKLELNSIYTLQVKSTNVWRKQVGDIVFVVEEPHNNHPFPRGSRYSGQYITHSNLAIHKVNENSSNKVVANYHIVKTTRLGKTFYYVYKSVKKKVIVDICGNWTKVLNTILSTAKEVVRNVSENGNLMAQIAIWTTIAVVIADLVVPTDPIPILPFNIVPVEYEV